MLRTLLVMGQNKKVVRMMRYLQAAKRIQSKVIGMVKYMQVVKRIQSDGVEGNSTYSYSIASLCYYIPQHPMMRWRRLGRCTRI